MLILLCLSNNFILKHCNRYEILVTILSSWLFLAEKTSDHMQDQMAQARKIALSHSSIATIETESFFHGKEAYLSFIGKDQEGQGLAVLVAQADDAVYTYPLKEGVSSKEAASVVKEKSQDAIDRVTFGRFKGKPIWEVKAGSSYYVMDFKTGKVTGVF